MNNWHSRFRSHVVICAFAVLGGVVQVQPAPAGPANNPPPIVMNIDGKTLGRTFDGIGALSAGASSRLLYDYPEPYRSEILDYLFKPKFGAGLQHLKVEIGGDVNSTDGSEPSIAVTREEFEHPKPEYFHRGYEWWLMKEAKKRNPNIILETLQWGAPGWVGGGKFYSKDNIDLIVAFLKAAKQYHHLDIDYQGIWNERVYDAGWIKQLRHALDANGLTSVKIDAADLCLAEQQWMIADDMMRDPELRNAVAALNAHVAETVNFYTPANAVKLNKPLWDGEAHAYGGTWYTAADCARFDNRAYVQGKVTKLIYWSVVTSYHDFLPASRSGIMSANTPWSGFYDVQPPLWAVAHTTQFAEPGWRYVNSGCRYFGAYRGSGLSKEGFSVVTLKSDKTDDYSIIVESMDAKEPQTVQFQISGGLSPKSLAVWHSAFKQEQFERKPDITPIKGEFTLTLVPNEIYSLTTTRGQRKGVPAHAIPAARRFPMPYSADFETEMAGKPGRYFSDLDGTFEVVRRPDGAGQCLKQIVTEQGIRWARNFPLPKTIIGDIDWTDYQVAVDVMLPKPGVARVWGRDHDLTWADKPSAGYMFEVKDDGTWALLVGDRALSSGHVAALGAGWHRVALGFKGDAITVEFDGNTLTTVRDNAAKAGLVSLGTDFNPAYFDNVTIMQP